MAKLTPGSRLLLVLMSLTCLGAALYTRRDTVQRWMARVQGNPPPASGAGAGPDTADEAGAVPAGPREGGLVIAAVSEWPGHMALLVGNGGLATQPGSAAAALGLNLRVVFIEDAAKKNRALQRGEVDFLWQTVDELPISLGSYRSAGVEPRAFLQIDWSRGGDACVASKDVRTVEDILGRRSAMMLFSPDHTVFEFMIVNSRLDLAQLARVRKDTSFSPDDFTFGRTLFIEGKVDVACLWEPDVTLALAGRPGAHRLFSTADATELVADVLLARRELLDARPEVAEKLARVWFAGVEKAEADRPAAARLIASVAPRFRDELGYQRTLDAFRWVKWTTLRDNVPFFGLDGQPPAFDRVYNHADAIWINYPQAEIKDRFAPRTLRDDRIVRRIWEAAGRPGPAREERYQPQLAAGGRPVFTRPVSIGFRSGTSDLDPEAMDVVNRHLLPQLEIARGMHIRVEGNTDALGDESWNKLLSQRRAQAIVEYLLSRGVDRSRIFARGNGSARPVSSNRTADGRARNRRTDVLFIPARGAADRPT